MEAAAVKTYENTANRLSEQKQNQVKMHTKDLSYGGENGNMQAPLTIRSIKTVSTEAVKLKRHKYKTNKPISGRQQAIKRNQPPLTDVSPDGDDFYGLPTTEGTKGLNASQLPDEALLKTQINGITLKKMRHQDSYADENEELGDPDPVCNLQDHKEEETYFTEEEEEVDQGDETNLVGNQIRQTKPRKWTPDEDELLRKAVADNGPKQWKTIAEFVPGRSHVQCLQRWNKVLKPGLRKGPWTTGEDRILQSLVENNPNVNWTEVSNQIHGRSAKQCRERWSFNLDPHIKKDEWSEGEDRILIDAQTKYGNRWAHISTLLPGRTENAVKTRFKSIMRAKKREWSPEEDEKLLQLQEAIGNKWEEIAKQIPNRTKNAVKTRYKVLTEDVTKEVSHLALNSRSETSNPYSEPFEIHNDGASSNVQDFQGFKKDNVEINSEVKGLQKFYTAIAAQESTGSIKEEQEDVRLHSIQSHRTAPQFQQPLLPHPENKIKDEDYTVSNILNDLANMDVDSLRENGISPLPNTGYPNTKAEKQDFVSNAPIISSQANVFEDSGNISPTSRPNLRTASLSNMLFASDSSLVEAEQLPNASAGFEVPTGLSEQEGINIPDFDALRENPTPVVDMGFEVNDVEGELYGQSRKQAVKPKCVIS